MILTLVLYFLPETQTPSNCERHRLTHKYLG